jgi:hypothetical protein
VHEFPSSQFIEGCVQLPLEEHISFVHALPSLVHEEPVNGLYTQEPPEHESEVQAFPSLQTIAV